MPYQEWENKMHDILKKLDKKRKLAIDGGGKKRTDSQHKKGKLTAKKFQIIFKLSQFSL